MLVGKELSAGQRDFLESLSGFGNKYYIIGGEIAVSNDIEETIKEYGEVTRIGGRNRFITSVLVAEEFFEKPSIAVLAYSQNYPDGLSGGPLAMSKNAPLILTASKFEDAAVVYTKGNGITKGAVLGGDCIDFR